MVKTLSLQCCVQKLRQLTCCLAALLGSDFAGSVCEQRYIPKLILERLLREHNDLLQKKELFITILVSCLFSLTVTASNAQESEILGRRIDYYCLQKSITWRCLSTGYNTIIWFGHALLPSYLHMLPAEVCFFSF